MSEEDQEKTAFITDRNVYCYTTMIFRLKNARVTNQHLVNCIFQEQISRNVETYVDSILLKSKTTVIFLSNMKEIFGILRGTQMMLNPKKYIFRIISKKFLSYLVSRKGIEANLDKIKAIQEMAPSRNIRDVQKLTGRLAALNRFLSRSVQRELSFFKVLKKVEKFFWIEECQQIFDQMNDYLHRLPTLTLLQVGETLYLYFTSTEEAMIAVLVQEDKVQQPVYCIS